MFSQNMFAVYLQYKKDFAPVIIKTYVSTSYRDCFDHIEQRQYPLKKSVKVFVKQLGTKHRHYHFDERFAAELEAEQHTDADIYYQETLDNVSVRVHQPDKRHHVVRAIWRGAVRRDDGRQESKFTDVWSSEPKGKRRL